MSGIKTVRVLVLLSVVLPCTGCVQDMWNGSRLKPLSTSSVFADGRSSRPLEADTVARGTLAADYLNPPIAMNGAETNTLPFPLTRTVLDRGQERYDACCAECHGYAGYGDGIVVQRGFPAPPSYHTDRLRNAPIGHFYDVITHGYGVMYPHNDRVKPADRWAIAAYIRALQLSQNAPLSDIPANERNGLTKAPLPTSGKTVPDTIGVPGETLPGDLLNGSAHP